MVRRLTTEERFWAKVGDTSDPDACWPWTASMYRNGYGAFYFNGRTNCAHRAAYEMFVGPISPGLVIDHLCRNRACVNPIHLEPVTQYVNLHRSPITLNSLKAAQTHCVHGHEFTPENTWYRCKGKGRYCKTCWKARAEVRKARECTH